MIQTEDLTVTVKIADCPACGLSINATVTVAPNLGPAEVTEDGRAVVKVEPTIERYAVNHPCRGRVAEDVREAQS